MLFKKLMFFIWILAIFCCPSAGQHTKLNAYSTQQEGLKAVTIIKELMRSDKTKEATDILYSLVKSKCWKENDLIQLSVAQAIIDFSKPAHAVSIIDLQCFTSSKAKLLLIEGLLAKDCYSIIFEDVIQLLDTLGESERMLLLETLFCRLCSAEMPEYIGMTKLNTRVHLAKAIAVYPGHDAKDKIWKLLLENVDKEKDEFIIDSLLTVCLKKKLTLNEVELKTILEADKSNIFTHSLLYTGLYEVSADKVIGKELIMKYRPELPPETFSIKTRKLFIKSALKNYRSIVIH